MGEPTVEYENPTYTNFNDVREERCDVTIVNKGTKHLAHKVVLASNLKYFTNEVLSLSADSKQDTIDLTGLGVNVIDLEPFISYAYTGKILLNIDNAIRLLKDAHALNENEIKVFCIKFIGEHPKVEEALKSDDFLDVDFESLKILLYDTKSDVESQQVLFEGIARWIMHNVQSRREHIDHLLSLIDMTKLTPEYMLHYIENLPDGNYLDGIKEILSCYRTSKLLKNKKRTVLLFQFIGETLAFQQYDLIDKTWSTLREIQYPGRMNLPPNLYNFPFTVILDDKLYFTHDQPDYGVFSFDFTSETIQKITAFQQTDSAIGMCACTKFLYVYRCITNEIEKYDLQTDSVETLKCEDYRVLLKTSVAIFYQNCIYFVGGGKYPTRRNRRNIIKYITVIKYDPVTNKTETCPPMCEERGAHAVAVLDGKLYACGGSDMNSVEVYEPATNRWRLIASMKQKRHSFLLVAYQGKLFAFGGDDEMTIEVYDPSKGQWQIDQEASSGLQIEHPGGGLISQKCLRQRDLKIPSNPIN